MTRTILIAGVLLAALASCPPFPPDLPEHPNGAQTSEGRALPPPAPGRETDGPTQPRTAAQRPIRTGNDNTAIGGPR